MVNLPVGLSATLLQLFVLSDVRRKYVNVEVNEMTTRISYSLKRSSSESDMSDSEVSGGGATATFESLLDLVGGRGRYQLFLFLVTSSSGFFTAFHHLGSIFLAATPDHWCSVPGSEDSSSWGANWTENRVKNYSIPTDSDGSYDQCHMWNRNYSNDVFVDPWSDSLANHTGLQQTTCQSYAYDHTDFDDTVVMQWDLVCSDAFLASTVQAIYMVGAFLGTFTYGLISDRHGRRLAVVISTLQFVVSAFLTAVPLHYAWYIVFRLFTGMGAGGIFTVTFVLMAEFISPSLRDVSGMAFQIPFGVGYMVLPGIAYLIRTWYLLQVTFACMALCTLSYYWLMPESPRWLIQHNKFPEALTILRRTAKFNGRQVSDKELLAMMQECYKTDIKTKSETKQESAIHILFGLFKTSQMRKHIFVSYYVWASVSFCYYGVSFNLPTIGDNIYLVTFLAALTEVPSYIVGAMIIRFLPRKINVILTFLLAGAACLLILAVPEGVTWAITFLGITGKFFINITYAIVYLYTTEIFPTGNRNVALGTSSMCARLGSTAAPYLATLVGGNMPLVIFGIISIIAGLLCILLPETRDRQLPETLSDVELVKEQTLGLTELG